MIDKRYPHRSGPPDERHRAPGPASATLRNSPLTTVQLHDMPTDEPAEQSESHLVTCRQRAAGVGEQKWHHMAAWQLFGTISQHAWRAESPPANATCVDCDALQK